MIFGSKALSVAVLGALVFSEEASAANIPDPCEISVSVCLPFYCALMFSHCNMNNIFSS